ncbi:MAG: hypothetical protein ACKOJF_29730, partial [Planctomycetaceae bacterium]
GPKPEPPTPLEEVKADASATPAKGSPSADSIESARPAAEEPKESSADPQCGPQQSEETPADQPQGAAAAEEAPAAAPTQPAGDNAGEKQTPVTDDAPADGPAPEAKEELPPPDPAKVAADRKREYDA